MGRINPGQSSGQAARGDVHRAERVNRQERLQNRIAKGETVTQRQRNAAATTAKPGGSKKNADGSGTKGETRRRAQQPKLSKQIAYSSRMTPGAEQAWKSKASKKGDGIPWYNDTDTIKAPGSTWAKGVGRMGSGTAGFADSIRDKFVDMYDNKEEMAKASKYASFRGSLAPYDFFEDGKIVSRNEDDAREMERDMLAAAPGLEAATELGGMGSVIKALTKQLMKQGRKHVWDDAGKAEQRRMFMANERGLPAPYSNPAPTGPASSIDDMAEELGPFAMGPGMAPPIRVTGSRSDGQKIDDLIETMMQNFGPRAAPVQPVNQIPVTPGGNPVSFGKPHLVKGPRGSWKGETVRRNIQNYFNPSMF